MILGQKDKFAIEWIIKGPEISGFNEGNYTPISLMYWINNKKIGNLTNECYLGDFVTDLAEIVRDNNKRNGQELCIVDKERQFMTLYNSIYNESSPEDIYIPEMPARYNITPMLGIFENWLIFAMKCSNKVMVLYSEIPFKAIYRHEINEHELDDILRSAFDHLYNMLNELVGQG